MQYMQNNILVLESEEGLTKLIEWKWIVDMNKESACALFFML